MVIAPARLERLMGLFSGLSKRWHFRLAFLGERIAAGSSAKAKSSVWRLTSLGRMPAFNGAFSGGSLAPDQAPGRATARKKGLIIRDPDS